MEPLSLSVSPFPSLPLCFLKMMSTRFCLPDSHHSITPVLVIITLSIIFINGVSPVQATLCRDTLNPLLLYTFNEPNGSSTVHDVSFFNHGKYPFNTNLRFPSGASSGYLVSRVQVPGRRLSSSCFQNLIFSLLTFDFSTSPRDIVFLFLSLPRRFPPWGVL